MIGSMNGLFSYGNYNFGSSGKNTSGVAGLASSGAFDYKAAQQRLKKAIDSAASDKTIGTMKKDTATFLDKYAAGMKNTKSSAQDVSAQLDKVVRDITGKDGAPSAETLDKAVASVQKMVDTYNETQAMLAKNETRGPGVSQRMDRLAQAMGSENSLKAVGITADAKGNLSLDSAKLRETLSGTAAQRTQAKDILSGSYGAATRLANAAEGGLTQNPTALVSNDLQKIQSLKTTQQDNLMEAAGLSGFSSGVYSRAGAYTMMNMGTVGMLMNMMA